MVVYNLLEQSLSYRFSFLEIMPNLKEIEFELLHCHEQSFWTHLRMNMRICHKIIYDCFWVEALNVEIRMLM